MRNKILPIRQIERKNNKCQGFTLIEVITVMAIIGVLAAIATPRILEWLPNIRLKSAARDLYSNMQKAKINAIKQNREWAVVFFDDANDRYSICFDPVDDKWETTGDNLCNETIILSDYRSGIKFGHGNSSSAIEASYGGGDGDHISYSDNLVTFNPRGFGNAGDVYLDNENDTSFAVGTRSSGTIKLQRWKGQWE